MAGKQRRGECTDDTSECDDIVAVSQSNASASAETVHVPDECCRMLPGTATAPSDIVVYARVVQASPDIQQTKAVHVGRTVLERIGQLPQIRLRGTAVCSICLATITGWCYDIKCRHLFHMECIFRWMYSRNVCPLCKCPILPGIFYGR